MLTSVDKLFLGLWAMPLLLGLGVGLRTGDDERWVLLFSTGTVTAMYLVAAAGMLHHARRRRRGGGLGDGTVRPGAPVSGTAPGTDDVETPRERARRLVVRAVQLLLVIPAAVHLAVAGGGWTFVVVAAQLIAVATMAAHVHRCAVEPDPVLP